MLDCQEQDSNAWHNITYGLRTKIQEIEENFSKRYVLQERARRSLAEELAKGRLELQEAYRVAHRERKERLRMKEELDELKGDFAKLKGMVRLAVAAQNLNNNGFPTEDIPDVFNSRIVEELSSDEEVPEENQKAIPVPGPLFHIPETLVEIPPSPSPSLRAFLAQPIVIASSIPPLGTSPQLLQLLVEDSSMGVGVTVTGGEGSITQWVHGEFIVISEAIRSHFTHRAHGEHF